MMTRIVKMTFKPEMVDAFIEVFESVKPRIEAFEGCHEVRLVRDLNQPHILMTISLWNDTDALEKYRHSELFKTTWAKTKIHFAAKPEAWSVETIR